MRVLASQGSGTVVLAACAANGLALRTPAVPSMSQGLEQYSLQLGILILRTVPSTEQSLNE